MIWSSDNVFKCIFTAQIENLPYFYLQSIWPNDVVSHWTISTMNTK